MPMAFDVAEGGKLMDVCLRGVESTRLRLRGVTVVLGLARMTTTVPHDKAKTGIVMPRRRHPLCGLEAPCRAPAHAP